MYLYQETSLILKVAWSSLLLEEIHALNLKTNKQPFTVTSFLLEKIWSSLLLEFFQPKKVIL